jgi:hypothetical protein
MPVPHQQRGPSLAVLGGEKKQVIQRVAIVEAIDTFGQFAARLPWAITNPPPALATIYFSLRRSKFIY